MSERSESSGVEAAGIAPASHFPQPFVQHAVTGNLKAVKGTIRRKPLFFNQLGPERRAFTGYQNRGYITNAGGILAELTHARLVRVLVR
jgi:hypothetical protein